MVGSRLIKVKQQIHRFLAELLWAIGEERAHDWGDELWKSLLEDGIISVEENLQRRGERRAEASR